MVELTIKKVCNGVKMAEFIFLRWIGARLVRVLFFRTLKYGAPKRRTQNTKKQSLRRRNKRATVLHEWILRPGGTVLTQ